MKKINIRTSEVEERSEHQCTSGRGKDFDCPLCPHGKDEETYCGICDHIGSENISERYPDETRMFLTATALCSLGIIVNTFGAEEFAVSFILASVSLLVSIIGLIK